MLNVTLNNQQHLITMIALVAALGLFVCLSLAALVLWFAQRSKRARQVQQRLHAIENNGAAAEGKTLRLWHEGKEATTVVPLTIGHGGLADWLEDLRVQAGWSAPLPSALLGLGGVLLAVGVAAFLFSGTLLVALGAPVAALIAFWIYLQQRIARRTTHFERNLIDALELAARSLRAGHPLLGSFQLIAEEIPAPVGDLFGRVCQQQDLGLAMEESLRAIADETPSDDMKLFATSVVIQMRSGGNLADMMMRLANVIRERNRLQRRIRVLTSQTQFSKRVLLALPFFVFILLNVMNPTYMQPLYNTAAGQWIMVASAAGLVLGWMMMNWLSKLNP